MASRQRSQAVNRARPQPGDLRQNLRCSQSIPAALLLLLLSGCGAPALNIHEQLAATERSSMEAAADYSIELKEYLAAGHTEQQAIEAVKAVVVEGFKDPDSATFKNLAVRDFQGGKLVCGEVNGKNSYGGYVGYSPFLASQLHAMVRNATDADNAFVASSKVAIDYACAKPVSGELNTRVCPPDVVGRLRASGASERQILSTCGTRK